MLQSTVCLQAKQQKEHLSWF